MAVKGVLFLVTITCFMSSYSSAREFPFPPLIPGFNLTGPGGPEVEGKALDCWTALNKIRSCSNEIVAYFANGTIDITPPCCEAITLITHSCWPAVLSALGYTLDQTYILRGYCDAIAPFAKGFGPVPSPLGQPLPAVN
ncbi:hypothetical protein Pfo_007708 [Paulownia fortunei]|nr:hypothetical protein Pfo_007708 [Paulownia fortunei]